jgi:hypothetical protein
VEPFPRLPDLFPSAERKNYEHQKHYIRQPNCKPMPTPNPSMPALALHPSSLRPFSPFRPFRPFPHKPHANSRFHPPPPKNPRHFNIPKLHPQKSPAISTIRRTNFTPTLPNPVRRAHPYFPFPEFPFPRSSSAQPSHVLSLVIPLSFALCHSVGSIRNPQSAILN